MTASANAPLQSDITIVGGGMVGAAMAGLLGVANPAWRITLIEVFPLPSEGARAFHPSFDDRSTAIAQGSVALLQQLGVWKTLLEQAEAIAQVHVSDKGHIGGTLIDRDEADVDALGYVIPNAWIGRVLLEHLQSLPQIQLMMPARVSHLQPVAEGARLTVLRDDGEVTLNTQLAIIADGADSPIRQQLGIESQVDDYRQTAIIANIGLKEPHKGVAYERFTDEGPMALLPLTDAENEQGRGFRSALVWTQPNHQAEEVLQLSDAEFLQRLQQRFGFRLGYFDSVGKRDSYPLQLCVASEQVRSSIAIMGNAAHFLHPVAGQGFNLALRDCAMLRDILCQAEKHKQPLGQLSVLQKYVDEQAFDQMATIGFSDKITKLFSTASLPAAGLRALGFMGLELLPPSKRWLVKQTMGAMTKSSLAEKVSGGGQ